MVDEDIEDRSPAQLTSTSANSLPGATGDSIDSEASGHVYFSYMIRFGMEEEPGEDDVEEGKEI